MIFVDTHYFLRFLLGDVMPQHIRAKQLFQKSAERHIELCTSTIVFFEINWVLSSLYNFHKDKITSVLKQILEMTFILVDERQVLYQALVLYEQTNLSLEDCYNLEFAKQKSIPPDSFKTFDKKLSRVADTYLQ